MRQTNYTREIAKEKLSEQEGNVINVIKDYMGIPINQQIARSKPTLQQEMFTQIRRQMDLSIRDFNEKQNAKLEQEIASSNNE
jgi:hypothetical protein